MKKNVKKSAKKSQLGTPTSAVLQKYLKDLATVFKLPVSKAKNSLALEEYPFDRQLLNTSRLYRESRKLYFSLGGSYRQTVSSTMRSLSSQDLFESQIDFTPALTEMKWFQNNWAEVADPEAEIEALNRFNEISIFHEQNHRVVWRLLPPPPSEKRDISRYLNFAESLVVLLDLALGDELGKELSPVFERMKVIYRSGGQHHWSQKSKSIYRQYLLALVCSTYYVLEMINSEDILKAVNYVLPGQSKINQQAVTRSLEISEMFTRITNPQWQERYWQQARTKLQKIHQGSKENPLYLPEDPLDLEEEFIIARRVLDFYGL